MRILTDRETGRPRGFAFVEFTDAAQAEEAVCRFHQQAFRGRPLVVNEARPREEGTGPGSGASGPFGRPAGPGPMERGPRPDQPTRNFGPDAPPRGKPKPKGPLRERIGGQFTAGGVDDSGDDRGIDDVAFWMRAAAESQDEE